MILTAQALKDAHRGVNKDQRERKDLKRVYVQVESAEGNEGSALRKAVNDVVSLSEVFVLLLHSEVRQVWAVAAQLRNDVKKKAKMVVEHAYGMDTLSKQCRVALATWLLKTHPMRVNGVKHDIPNFVFGDMELSWNRDGLDTKVSLTFCVHILINNMLRSKEMPCELIAAVPPRSDFGDYSAAMVPGQQRCRSGSRSLPRGARQPHLPHVQLGERTHHFSSTHC